MKNATTSVGFKDPLGVLVANGNLILDLSQSAEVISGGGLVVPTRVILPLDATAKITSTPIFFNDELTPSGTTYSATLLNSAGSRVANFGAWSLSGASVDLSTMVPVSSSVSYAGAVMLTPSGNQTIASGNLTLTSGTFVETATPATGTSGLVRATSPTLVTPALGVATATSIVASSKLTAGVAAAGGSTTGDITAARSTTSGAYYLGSDGAGFLFRNGNTVTLQGTSLVWTMPATTDTLVGKATTDALTNKGFGDKVALYNNVSIVGNGLTATYGQDDKTSQSASIGTVTLLTGTASSGGHYQISFTTRVTTSDASGATYILTLNWTEDGIARSSATSPIAFASTANGQPGTQVINADNSTNVTYSTTVTGSPTTGRYAVHVWLAKQ